MEAGWNRQSRAAALLFLAMMAPVLVRGQIPGMSKAPSANSTKLEDRDPLGRDTPRGCVVGFLRASERGEYSKAAEYLDLKPSTEAVERARQLLIVLNAGRASNLEAISDVPEGDLNDGLAPNRERVGTIQTTTSKLEIFLQRVQRGSLPPLWLVSSQTLEDVPAASEELEGNSIERLVPRPLRETRFLHLPLYRWLGTLLGLALALVFAYLGSRLLIPVLRPLIRRVTQEPDDRCLPILLAPLRMILLAGGFRALAMVSATALSRQFWTNSAQAMSIVGAAWLAIRISNVVAELTSRRLTRRAQIGSLAALALIHRLFKIGVVLVCAVTMVWVEGGDVTAIMAGVGLGGIAIALAAQKTLENLFGGVALISDKPIRVGDFCRLADKLGTVEDIGLRSTRIRTMDRTVLSIPNGQLSNMTLENYTLRDSYVFKHKIGLRYETTPGQLRSILDGIRALLRDNPIVDPVDARIRLVQFGDCAFVIEIFVYLLESDYLVFLEIQEELLLGIMDIVVAAGSGFAYPSQTLYIAQESGRDHTLIEEAEARVRQRRTGEPAAYSGRTVK